MSGKFLMRDEILVRAPLERCFLLSTSVELVQRELRMRPVKGRTTGLVVGGDVVVWKGWQLGLPQFHESVIEDFRAPVFFRDRMTAGRFAQFEHDHSFEDRGDGTVLLRDEIRFTMPWGWLGVLAGRLVLAPHVRRLMKRRFALLKRIAEGDEWRAHIPEQKSIA